MATRAIISDGGGGRGTATVPVLPIRDAVHFPALVNTLHIVREASQKALRRSLDRDRRVLVLSQRDMAQEDPTAHDLYRVGTLSEALQTIPLPDGSLRVALRGLKRVRATRLHLRGGSFSAEIEELEEIPATGLEADALCRTCAEAFTRIVQLNKEIPPEALHSVLHLDEAGPLADAILHHLPVRPAAKQELLEELDHARRLEQAMLLLKREEQILDLNAHIVEEVERKLQDTQREFYLREQLRVIQEELRGREDRLGETEEYEQRLRAAGMPGDALDRAMVELGRLDRTPAASPEGMVLRNYLDTLIGLPWALLTEDRLDVDAAAKLLDDCHFGLENVKERILDHLAVRQLKRSLRGPILCFVGPPGVGKTSIVRSLAEAMNRRFARISLGGVRDEAEIRGHRRTYVGSMPGRILQAVRDCGSRNPVVLLDEIDKLTAGAHGDPASALLEALDPEQNDRFVDHYVEAPFDLSAVMFVATANLIDQVPPALRDRMEVIEFPGYSDADRREIARRFLVPRAIEDHGLTPAQCRLPAESLEALIHGYTRESGVRSLERAINTLCRKVARRVAEGHAEGMELTRDRLIDLLGSPRYRAARADGGGIGAANALVVGAAGGEIATVESTLLLPYDRTPQLQLTGNLGDVMKESAHTALTCIRALGPELAPGREFRFDIHLHVPEGAVPKDGPSAGLAVAVALASAFTEVPVRGDVAMTGEITLHGRVLPVGGVREKVLAAHRAKMTRVLIPEDNLGDLDQVPGEVLREIAVVPIRELREAVRLALESS
jgi:ATP-dependent Lon protease